MYDPSEIFQRIDDNLALVLIFGGLSFGCLFVYFWETARLGVLHRCAPMTLLAASVFVAHDGNFVINFDDWFNTYDNWLFKGFWAALVVTTGFELFFLWTIIRFGREEMAPGLSQRDFTLVCLGGVVAAIVAWAAFKVSVSDPLYLISFMLTIFWCLPSISTLYLRRGVRRGMSVRQLWAYCGMTLGYVLLTIVVFEFHALWWIALCAVTLAWGALLTWAVSRAPAWQPEPATPRGLTRVGEPAPAS